MDFFPAEAVRFYHPSEEKKMLSLPEIILSRDDVALVGTGSLSCIRALYISARDFGKAHQFFPCITPAEEYATGENGLRLEACLNRVLKVPGVGGIIVYASCMDVLNQTDFETVFSHLDNAENIPVEVLYRGPMAKRYMKPTEQLKEIFSSMPETGKKISPAYEALPPIGPDFNCISSALQYMDSYPFLITPGGCAGGVEEFGAADKKYLLKNSRLSDVQVSLGCEKAIKNCIAEDYHDTYSGSSSSKRRTLACLMGSAVPAFTGMDCDSIANELTDSGVPAVYLPSDGFTPGSAGFSKAMLALCRAKVRKSTEKDAGRINILGYCSALLGREDKLAHGIEHLNRLGLTCTVWGRGDIEHTSEACLNWVVSAAGLQLAKLMKNEFGIPYISGIPVGEHAVLSWQEQIKKLVNAGNEDFSFCEPSEPFTTEKQPKILIIHEPMLMGSIRSFFKEELGYTDVTLAVYAPLPNLRKFYGSVCGDLPLRYFSSAEELLELGAGANYVIADPVYGKYFTGSAFIPLPDPQISGEQYLDMPYEIFGKKGAAYLSGEIKKHNGETL